MRGSMDVGCAEDVWNLDTSSAPKSKSDQRVREGSLASLSDSGATPEDPERFKGDLPFASVGALSRGRSRLPSLDGGNLPAGMTACNPQFPTFVEADQHSICVNINPEQPISFAFSGTYVELSKQGLMMRTPWRASIRSPRHRRSEPLWARVVLAPAEA